MAIEGESSRLETSNVKCISQGGKDRTGNLEVIPDWSQILPVKRKENIMEQALTKRRGGIQTCRKNLQVTHYSKVLWPQFSHQACITLNPPHRITALLATATNIANNFKTTQDSLITKASFGSLKVLERKREKKKSSILLSNLP